MKPEALTRFLAVAGLAILSFCAIVSLATVWLGALLHLPPTLVLRAAGHRVHTGLELLSFASTAIVLPGISTWAVWFARGQAREARRAREESENIRLSGVYMDIVTRWNARDLVTARKRIFDLVAAFPAIDAASPGRYAGAEDYIDERLSSLRETDKVEHRRYVILLQFFEDLGLLCRKQYIREADVFDFLGSPIRTQLAYLSKYIAKVRQEPDGRIVRSRYANAIYLYKRAVASQPHAHEEEMW